MNTFEAIKYKNNQYRRFKSSLTGRFNYAKVTKDTPVSLVDITFYVLARDLKHAVKIVNERRIQMLALGTWTG